MANPHESPEASAVPADDLRAELAHANMRALQALLNLQGDAESFSTFVRALHPVFAQDQAIVLAEEGDALVCAASAPDDLSGARWPVDAFFQGVLQGQVVHVGRDRRDQPHVPLDLVPPHHAALVLPIGVDGRRMALILRREGRKGDFGVGELAFARQCAVLALAALAARNAGRLEAEISGLRRMVDDLRTPAAQPSEDFLRGVVDALPVGVTVQDEDGRFVLVNAVAAANLATSAEVLIGASPADFLPAEEAAQRRQWEIDLVRSGRSTVAEENVTDASGERTWLSAHTPADILGRTLLLSTSVDITERKDVENKMAQRAYFDDLTGLPNGVLIQERVEEALGRAAGRFALAFLDLDNFKHINDYFSHAIGDALLVKVAERIQKNLRDSDMIARISGDEFLLLLDPVESDEQIGALIDRLLHEMKQPFHVEAFEIFTSASLGVSIHPEHGASYEALRHNADNALSRAKSGLLGAAIYDLAMGEKIAARMELEQRLRLAIRDGKFCCAFQPKVDIHSQEVVGFETLVRWRDESGEIRPPSSFIGLAIELGLIDPITEFVLADSVGSIARLDQAFGAGTTISINIAARQASDMTFMQALAGSLKDSRYAERIMLELTEEAFVAKGQFQLQVLPMLRDLGIRVSIDDFGTGYSSLSVLADITADEVKVDRSFITNIHQRPRSQSVLRTIESLCHALGMTVIAEGVETVEELAYLQTASRIQYAQGYYFSKPFFLEDLKDTRRLAADIRPVEAARGQGARRGPFSARESREARIGRG